MARVRLLPGCVPHRSKEELKISIKKDDTIGLKPAVITPL